LGRLKFWLVGLKNKDLSLPGLAKLSGSVAQYHADCPQAGLRAGCPQRIPQHPSL